MTTMSSPTDSRETIKRSYRPIVIVHGLMTGDVTTMQRLAARIVEVSNSLFFVGDYCTYVCKYSKINSLMMADKLDECHLTASVVMTNLFFLSFHSYTQAPKLTSSTGTAVWLVWSRCGGRQSSWPMICYTYVRYIQKACTL